MNARTIAGGIAQTLFTLLLLALAWRYGFWQADVYLFVLASASTAIALYLWHKDPELLERRMRGPQNESQLGQRLVHFAVVLLFIGAIVLASFDRGFSWSNVPLAAVIAGDAVVALGCFIYFIVFRANTFAAATVEVAPGQHVISSGPYAIVRHPMYVGLLAVLAGTPPALGSWWGLLTLVPMALAVVWRILYEESFLAENLPGYAEYARSVRYRLIPLVW